MKKRTETFDNDNFYHLKKLQWKNQSNMKLIDKNYLQNIDSNTYLKENAWNKRFIYNKIQNYDSSKDKNVIANIFNIDKMNCYHNAIKKNDIIVKTFYSKNKIKKKFGDEYNKTNLRIILNPMGRNFKQARIMRKSASTNKFSTSKKITFDSIQVEQDKNKTKNTNNNKIPEKLEKLWKYLCVRKEYQNSFNLLLSQLSDQMKNDICEREYKELYELRNDLQLLSTSVYFRTKILDEINFFNEKLGINLRARQTNSSEIIIKKITNKINNLRQHTVNICFLMKKIKSKINGAFQWGKYDFDLICEKFKFDKNYLIKMKEEMNVLNEGYAKYFFDIGEENNPFLLNTCELSENTNSKYKNFFFHNVPVSEEMKNYINQSIYIIYQDLITYQNTTGSENNFKSISPIKKYKYSDIDIKFYKSTNEKFNTNFKNILNNTLFRCSSVSTIKTNYTDKCMLSNFVLSGMNTENNKNSNSFKNTIFNINKNENKDLTFEKDNLKINFDINNKNDKNMNKNNNINKYEENNEEEKGNNEINTQKENISIEKDNLNHDEILNKSNKEENLDLNYNFDEKSEKPEKNEKIINDNLKISNFNKIITPIKSKNLKTIIFRDDITIFSKDFYPYYFSSIPEEIKNMQKINQDIINHISQEGISPYMLIVYQNENGEQSESKENDDNNWEKIKNYILGLCVFNYKFKDNLIKLNINHISNIIPPEKKEKEEEKNTNYIVDNIKKVFSVIIEYIKKNFYFDEMILEYNSSKVNEQILNFFLNDLNFVVDNESNLDDNKDKENDNNKNVYNQMIYTNDSSKNRVNDSLRESILGYLDKNIFDIFDAMIITHNTELLSSERKKSDDSNIVNNVLMKYLLEKKERTNMNKIYNKITNLSQLIEIFQSNNINKKQIPLSLAQNRFDIICSAINKTSINTHFNNSIFFNNYNLNNPCSFYDNNTGIHYNLLKADKVLLIQNDNYYMKMYHIICNNLGLIFCKVSEDLKKYLDKDNIYIQLNNLYKELISSDKIQILKNKILWIPCFEINKHIKTISTNSVGTFHEYIKISNKIIRKKINKEPLLVNNRYNNKDNKQSKIEPDSINDIIIDNDFIFGLVNNSEILYDKFEKEEINHNRKDEPYIVFVSMINKSDFIKNSI